MNKIIPILLGSLVCTGYANAADNGEFLIMEDDVDIIRRAPEYSTYNIPKRTSFFTGMEYNETVSDYFARTENIKYVVADGSTRLHDNWRIRYVLSQIQNKSGIEQETSYKKTNFTIAPRYEQWVNPWFSFFAEPVYVHQSDPDAGLTNTEIKLRPGLQFTYGKHGLNTVYTYSMVEKETENENINTDFDTFEVKANYLYRYGSRLNFGLEFTRNGYVDNSDPQFRRRAFAVKPSVRIKHWKGIVTEISTPYNYNEAGVKLSGSETVKINLNNNYPINKNMKLIANFGYAMVKLHESGVDKETDKNGFDAKLGFNLSF
ncbi:hypothetical protein RJ45_17025 [Photobacterium gaetbulicola]|uniref:Porin n=1 Tax=Photobacterium gaetbulicola TaxID=1295392 RepID=A0A0B9G1F3_9GAMM|nr:hypothetical protein [Photobacterium gaetbulicola]KHT62519.1 hypothetical protein RJ45_17025 [Photobacterium gaetbulicola]